MAVVLLFAASADGGSLSCCGGSTDAGSTGGGTTVPEVEQHSHSFFAHPAGLGPGDQYHILFATSTVAYVTNDTSVPPPTPAEFGGIDAADWIVTYRAAFAGLVPGWNGLDLVYRSILSIDGDNAVDRLSIVGPVYNTNGDLLANDAADLWDGSLVNPVGYNEKGELIASNTQVWTGTGMFGTWASGESCGDWDIPPFHGVRWTGQRNPVEQPVDLRRVELLQHHGPALRPQPGDHGPRTVHVVPHRPGPFVRSRHTPCAVRLSPIRPFAGHGTRSVPATCRVPSSRSLAKPFDPFQCQDRRL